MADNRVWARLNLEDVGFELGEYDVEYVELDGGEAHSIELTVGQGDISFTIDFPLEGAEEFLVEFRDEIVRAKQAQLEWQTDTDPATGVAKK